MQAVINAVRGFLPHLRSRVVWLMCDNAVTVAYIKNKGGTRSYTLMQLTIHLLKWCDRKAIKLVPVHLLGVCNVQADALSRIGHTLNTEWTLAMECPRPVFTKWGKPQLDMVATFANRWLIEFASPYPDPRADWTDAMSTSWDNGRGILYASAPAHPKCRSAWRKKHVTTGLRAILVAKGHSWEAADMMSRSLRQSSLQVCELHWGRFIHFCRTKQWKAFNVRSHHFSTYLMHLFRDGLLSSTIISHRTSVASVLCHWKYDPAVDPHIKLLIRAFRLERPVQCRIVPKWDLHLVLSALMSPPFAWEVDDRQVCIRKRKYPASESGVLVIGSQIFGQEPASIPGSRMDHSPRYRSSQSGGTREDVFSGQTAQAISKGYRQNPGGCQRLFIHWNRAIKDVMRSYFSKWIVETVKEAYTWADRDQEDRVIAHEVRALSASLAYWRLSGVFQKSYLCDMASIADGMSTLHPVVVAQQVVDPGHLLPPP